MGKEVKENVTGKSFSEAFIFVSTNAQYDKIWFIALQDMKMASSEHVENMLRTLF